MLKQFLMTKRTYFYGVVTENFKGVVSSWAECENLVIGVSLARHKKFACRNQAQKFVDSDGDYNTPVTDYTHEQTVLKNWLLKN